MNNEYGLEAHGTNSRVTPERRHHPRVQVCLALSVTCSNGMVVEGYTENLSLYGMLIQSVGGMPVLSEECSLTLYLEEGAVVVRGNIVRLNGGRRKFAVQVTHVAGNGPLLLARHIQQMC